MASKGLGLLAVKGKDDINETFWNVFSFISHFETLNVSRWYRSSEFHHPYKYLNATFITTSKPQQLLSLTYFCHLPLVVDADIVLFELDPDPLLLLEGGLTTMEVELGVRVIRLVEG